MVRKHLAVIGGLVVGLLMIRSVRNRRGGADQEQDESAESEADAEAESDEHAELETAADHAAAAVEHARVAATMALEERREAT